ncbi:MAG: glycoside hydrolase family 127 protein, partial [Candidatus Latescibacteria bacterium]|nr:glycoside hydrolase family 127 protein [Candidatus Latescibacterota bacterium]
FYHLGRITGNPLWADRCEDVTLNHFPPSSTPDLKGLHYLTASNQPQLDASGEHHYCNQGRQIDYSPHLYRCCQHNVAMGWPWYAQHLWMASPDQGLVAWLYAACRVQARVGAAGDEVHLRVHTDYPFGGEVEIEVQCSRPVEFPLYLRVPRWCRAFHVSVAGKRLDLCPDPGTYVRIARRWVAGDRVAVNMPMELALSTWPRNGSVTVERGPLSYSLAIGEEWRRCGGTDEWPEWEVLPTTPWNYGLVLDPAHPLSGFEVRQRGPVPDQPWTPEGAPLEIRAHGKRIPGWKLEKETVQELRQSPVCSDQPEEQLTLIPLGCARLRLACLPVIGEGEEAREWHA